MRVYLLFLTACVQLAGATNSKTTKSEPSPGALTPIFVTIDEMLKSVFGFFDHVQLSVAAPVCKEFNRQSKDAFKTIFAAANHPLFQEMGPSLEKWQLFKLATGLMEDRFDQVLRPGSAIWPTSPETVKYAAETILKDKSISEEYKIRWCDHLSTFLHMHKYFDVLASLILSSPRTYSRSMNPAILHPAHGTLQELARINPQCLARASLVHNSEIRISIWATIFSMNKDLDFLQSLFSFVFVKDVEFVARALMGLGKSCTLQSEESLNDCEPMFQRNILLIEQLSASVRDGSKASVRDGSKIFHCREYALLLNSVRFASKDTEITVETIEHVDSICKQAEWFRHENTIYDVLIAAMCSQRHGLFKEVWMRSRSGLSTMEFESAIASHPEFISYLSFEECNLLILGRLKSHQIMHIVRSRSDIYSTNADVEHPYNLTCLIVAAEVCSPDEFMNVLNSRCAGLDETDRVYMLTRALDYFSDVFDKLRYPLPFIGVFKELARCKPRYPSESNFTGNESLLRVLLSDKMDDGLLREILTGVTIDPSLQFIHVLLTDTALAAAISTDHARPIRDCLSTKMLIDPIRFNLSGKQIMRLLQILKIPVHESSFTFQGGALVESVGWWLEASVRTFGEMTKHAAKPGFLAHLAYCIATKDLKRVPASLRLNPEAPVRLNRDGWPNNYHEYFYQPYMRRSLLRSSIDSGSPNPVLFHGFDLLHLWFLRDFENFKLFAPPLVVRAFVPVPATEIFNEIRIANVLTDEHRRKVEVYLSGVTLQFAFSLQRELNEFRDQLPKTVRCLLHAHEFTQACFIGCSFEAAPAEPSATLMSAATISPADALAILSAAIKHPKHHDIQHALSAALATELKDVVPPTVIEQFLSERFDLDRAFTEKSEREQTRVQAQTQEPALAQVQEPVLPSTPAQSQDSVQLPSQPESQTPSEPSVTTDDANLKEQETHALSEPAGTSSPSAETNSGSTAKRLRRTRHSTSESRSTEDAPPATADTDTGTSTSTNTGMGTTVKPLAGRALRSAATVAPEARRRSTRH